MRHPGCVETKASPGASAAPSNIPLAADRSKCGPYAFYNLNWLFVIEENVIFQMLLVP